MTAGAVAFTIIDVIAEGALPHGTMIRTTSFPNRVFLRRHATYWARANRYPEPGGLLTASGEEPAGSFVD